MYIEIRLSIVYSRRPSWLTVTTPVSSTHDVGREFL